jgi:hypothetical protein
VGGGAILPARSWSVCGTFGFGPAFDFEDDGSGRESIGAVDSCPKTNISVSSGPVPSPSPILTATLVLRWVELLSGKRGAFGSSVHKVRSKKERVRKASGWMYIDTSPKHSTCMSLINTVDIRRSERPLMDSSPRGIGELMSDIGELRCICITNIIPEIYYMIRIQLRE